MLTFCEHKKLLVNQRDFKSIIVYVQRFNVPSIDVKFDS